MDSHSDRLDRELDRLRRQLSDVPESERQLQVERLRSALIERGVKIDAEIAMTLAEYVKGCGSIDRIAEIVMKHLA